MAAEHAHRTQGMTEPTRFRGWVSCRRDGDGPLGLILVGSTVDHPEEIVHYAFSCPAPADMPDALEDVIVEQLGERGYRVTSGDKEWVLEAAGHLHREIAAAFYRAIPPRVVPWRKRAFWQVVLKLAEWRLIR
jgi:hypothetical protein